MSDNFIIKVSSLWDAVNDNLQRDKIIHVENGKIKSIGSFENIPDFPGIEILDWTGLTILPGLIDCHTHLSMDASMDGYLDHMADPVPELMIRAMAMMKRDLASGVTTCRCCGDKEFLDIAIKRGVSENLFAGPRLLVAGKGIRATKGHGFVGYPFNGPDEIRKAVVDNMEAGVDFIKIYDAGFKVAAHCVGGEGLDWAIEAGLDSIEHAYHITAEQLKSVEASDTRIVLTPGAELSDEIINRLPERLIEGHLREREDMKKSMALVISSGHPFAVGTDGIHGGIADELIHLKNLGADPLTLLKAATIHGVEVCGLDHLTGSVENGKDADLIAVEGNPLSEIEILKNIAGVVRQGKIIGSKHPNI